MTTAARPKWGDRVALIAPTAGPKEGLVVDVNVGGGVTVEAPDGSFVGGAQWLPASKFYVIREGSPA